MYIYVDSTGIMERISLLQAELDRVRYLQEMITSQYYLTEESAVQLQLQKVLSDVTQLKRRISWRIDFLRNTAEKFANIQTSE